MAELKFKTGTQSQYDTAKIQAGELGFTNDTGRLYYGGGGGTNYLIGENLFKQVVGGNNLVSCKGFYIDKACFITVQEESGYDEVNDCITYESKEYMLFTVTATQPDKVTVYENEIDFYKDTEITLDYNLSGQSFITNDKHYDFAGEVETVNGHYYVDYDALAAYFGYDSHADLIDAVNNGVVDESEYNTQILANEGSAHFYKMPKPFDSWIVMSAEDIDVDDYSIVFLNTPDEGPVDFFERLGGGSIAVGNNCKTINRAAASIGRDNVASGQYSVVFGRENEGSYASFVSGRGNKGRGYYSLVAGSGCTVEATAGTAVGRSSIVDGAGAGVALGQSCKARACGAVALGSNVYTTYCEEDGSSSSDDVSEYARGQVVVGRYNADPGKDVFVVGVGSKKTAKNAFTVNSSVVTSLVSFKVGSNNTASGAESFVGGKDCEASGDRSLAFGFGSKATSTRSIAIGQACISNGTGTVAIGSNLTTIASSRGQTVVGRYNDPESLTSNDVFVVGGGTSTTPNNAMKVDVTGSIITTPSGAGYIKTAQVKGTSNGCGSNAFLGGMIATGETGGATGAQSFAYGTSCEATVQSAVALGQACKARALGAAAIGSNLKTSEGTGSTARGQVVVGRYNDPDDMSTSDVFVVGGGSSASKLKNLMRVYDSEVKVNTGFHVTSSATVQGNITANGSTGFVGKGSSITNLNASNLASGTVPIARIPTGTSSTTVAKGDHTHSPNKLTWTKMTSLPNEHEYHGALVRVKISLTSANSDGSAGSTNHFVTFPVIFGGYEHGTHYNSYYGQAIGGTTVHLCNAKGRSKATITCFSMVEGAASSNWKFVVDIENPDYLLLNGGSQLLEYTSIDAIYPF